MDNLLLFGIGDLSSIEALQQVFDQLSRAYRLQPNLNKSLIYIGGISQQQ